MKSLNIKFCMASIAVMPFLLNFAHGQTVLQGYIEEGLKDNIILQQKEISLQQAQQSLQIARSYFLPSVNALADYTTGQGGRSIEMPIGDLLNPVYQSLNQLTQSDEFRNVENVKQNFFPRNFYDARVRASVPIINTDLHVNQSIHGQKVLLKEYELDAYKRELILDIKSAYYNHLAAVASVKIFESAQGVMNKNVEINESLLRNGKSLPANVMRSKSEAEKIKAELNSARAQVTNSRKYFNFLLNKDLDTDIQVDESFSGDEPDIDGLPSIENREELQMVKSVQEINQSSIQLYKLSRLPKVNAFVDLGSQASEWHVNSSSKYYLFGVQLALPIFQGFRNNIQIKQNKMELEKSELEYHHTASKLQVAADMALTSLNTSRQNYEAAQEQLKSARSYFNLVDKGYQQGVNSLIEFLDGRNQLTSSELQSNLRHYNVLKAIAQYERETSSYNLPK